MHKPETVPENKTHNLHGDFDTRADHLISARQPDLVIVKKNNKKQN